MNTHKIKLPKKKWYTVTIVSDDGIEQEMIQLFPSFDLEVSIEQG